MWHERVYYYIGIGALLGGTVLMPVSGDELLRVLGIPEVRALLDVISCAEGTMPRTQEALRALQVDPRGYHRLFGGGSCASLKDHPKRVVGVKSQEKRYYSSAAGRYQICAATWDHYMNIRRINRHSGDTSFSPLNQDRVAAQLIVDCNVLPILFDDPCNFSQVIKLLGKKWASLPGSPYGHPTPCSLAHLERVFKERVKVYERYGQRVHGGGGFV